MRWPPGGTATPFRGAYTTSSTISRRMSWDERNDWLTEGLTVVTVNYKRMLSNRRSSRKESQPWFPKMGSDPIWSVPCGYRGRPSATPNATDCPRAEWTNEAIDRSIVHDVPRILLPWTYELSWKDRLVYYRRDRSFSFSGPNPTATNPFIRLFCFPSVEITIIGVFLQLRKSEWVNWEWVHRRRRIIIIPY